MALGVDGDDDPADQRSGPENQTRKVCEPATTDDRFELPAPPMPGSSGRPRSARCTTVPDAASSRAVCTSTSNCAAERGGRLGSAEAASVRTAALPPTTVTRTTIGTPQRSADCDADIDIGVTSWRSSCPRTL
jgi:hypothetical protein